MRLINRKSRKDEKKRLQREELSLTTGIRFSDELTSGDNRFPYSKYIVNAFILFCAAFGSFNCIVTAFELDMTVIPMAFSCVAAAFAFSFMYISKKAKIVTYLLVLVGIIISGTVFFSVFNSGVSAIRNNCLKLIDEKSGLPFLREFTISFTDEYAAMSVAACLIAVALMLFINIFVSERMSLLMLFVITFPFVQFGMFFDLIPSDSSMIMVVASWVTVAVVKLTDAYNGLTVKAAAKSSVKKHRHSYGFVTDSKNTAHIAGLWLSAVLVVTVAVFMFIPGENFDMNLPTDSARKYSEKYVKNFLSYGLGAVFAYESNPSNPGSLANVSAVYFDGNTDLKVTLVNYMVSRIYIKEYTGYIYNSRNREWAPPYRSDIDIECVNSTPEILKYDFEHNRDVCLSRHRIDIEITDEALLDRFPGIPYFSLLGDSGYYDIRKSEISIPREDKDKVQTYEVYTVDTIPKDYSAILNSMEEGDEKERFRTLKEITERDAYENALGVPERNVEAIEKFCAEYGISPEDDNVVEKVVTALEDNYEYTLRPGKVPYNEDYVNYFLLASKKGYCQHFASAAVLIFRYLGIPARYAEGYALDKSEFADSEIQEGLNYEDWIDADYTVVRSVNTVEVKDESGHAWAEVYMEGFGWIPVEATTAVPVESKQSALSGVFGNLLNNGSQGLMDSVRRINVEKTRNRCLLLLVFAALVAAAFYFIRMAMTVIRRHRGFSTENFRTNLANRYVHLKESYLFSSNLEGKTVSYRELIDMLSSDGYIEPGKGTELYERLEECLFSDNDSAVQPGPVTELMSLRKAVYKGMSLPQKLRYCFVKILW